MQLSTHVHFDGRCEEAFNLYKEILGGEIQAMITHEGTPAENQVPPEWRKKIIHARLVIGDQVLLGCDTPPSHYQKPQGFSTSIDVKDPAEAERIFHRLAENGAVRMPIQETFWAIRFGMLVDRFGIPWMVNCSKAEQLGQTEAA